MHEAKENYIFVERNWYGNTGLMYNAVKEAMGHKYNLVVDLKDGKMYLASSVCRRKSLFVIEKYDFRMFNTSDFTVTKCLSKVKHAVREYDYMYLRTRSASAEIYGKKNVVEEAFIRTAENPNSGWGMMYMYDTNVIEYYMQKKS